MFHRTVALLAALMLLCCSIPASIALRNARSDTLFVTKHNVMRQLQQHKPGQGGKPGFDFGTINDIGSLVNVIPLLVGKGGNVQGNRPPPAGGNTNNITIGNDDGSTDDSNGGSHS